MPPPETGNVHGDDHETSTQRDEEEIGQSGAETAPEHESDE